MTKISQLPSKLKVIFISASLSTLMLLLAITGLGLFELGYEEFTVRLAWHTILAINVFMALIFILPVVYWLINKFNINNKLDRWLPIIIIAGLIYFVVLLKFEASLFSWVLSLSVLNVPIIKKVESWILRVT